MPRIKKAKTPKTPRVKRHVGVQKPKVVPGSAIVGNAMLVNVKIRVWEARKHDRKITDEVNTQHGASHDAGRYHKHLFGGKVPSHGHVINAGLTARFTHYRQTLPWSDDGWRLLPTTNYFEYMEALRKVRREFQEAVDAFLAEYPELCKAAEERLNGMYNSADYPTPTSLRHKFSCEVEFSPLPTGADFRVDLPKQELAQATADVEARLQKGVQVAMEDAWSRLADVVSAISERLDDQGRYLKDEMFAKCRAVAESLGRLNITKDPHLEEVRQQVIKDLTQTSAEVLKADESKMQATAAKARDILKAMDGLYGKASEEAEEEK